MVLVNRLVWFAGLYAGSAALLRVFGFLLSLWMARVLAVEDYGHWGLLYACQTGLTTFGIVGLLEAAIGLLKEHSSPQDRARLLAAVRSAFVLTLALSLTVVAAGGAWFLVANASVTSLVAVAASGSLLAYASLQAQLARLDEHHTTSLNYAFIVPIVGLVGSAAAFALWRTPASYFIGSALGFAVTLAALGLRSAAVRKAAIDAALRQQVLRRLPPFIVVAFLGWMSGYGNNFVIDAWFDRAEVGRFTFALALGSLAQIVSSALNQTWSPRFFRLTQSEPFEEVERRNRRFVRLHSLTLGALAALTLVLLPPLLRALGGNLAAYGSMRAELLLMFAAYIALGPWLHGSNYFLAYDHGNALMRVVVTTSVVGIAVWLSLMAALGAIGIYIGFFTQMVIRSVGIVIAARHSWPLKTDWFGVAGGMLLAAGGYWAAGA